MTELEAYKDLIRCCFTLHTNLNDTFYWATADVGEVQADDIEKILPIYKSCGFDTLIAYEAIVRGHDPVPSIISRWDDKGENYWKAKALLEPMAASGQILWERWSDLEDDKQDLAQFGSKITWSSFESRKRAKLLIGTKPGTDGNVLMRVATLADGTFAVGRSTTETRDRLTAKYQRLHPKV